MQLIVTESIDTRQAERLGATLRSHLEVVGPYTLARKTAEPSELAQYIQLLGDAALWLPLLYGAKVFLKAYLEALGKRAGEATWDGLAGLLKTQEVKPLADVATALADACKASSGNIEIIVGLDIPDNHFGTAMVITATSAEEIAHALAAFVTRANKVSAMMKAEMEAGRAPLGRAVVTLEKEGSLTVRWRSQDSAKHEKQVS